MFGDRQRDTGDVHFLETVPADQSIGHVPGDGHQRRGIQVRRGDAGYKVCRTGAGSGNDHTHIPRGSGVAVRGMTGTLFVGCQHVMDAVFPLVQGIIQIDDLSARVSEHSLCSLLNQSFNYNIRTTKQHSYPFLSLQTMYVHSTPNERNDQTRFQKVSPNVSGVFLDCHSPPVHPFAAGSKTGKSPAIFSR